MRPTPAIGKNALLAAVLVCFLAAASYLFFQSQNSLAYDSRQLIWDVQWLSAFALLFGLVLAAVWNLGTTDRSRALLTIGCLSVWGIVTVALLLNGTPYGYNGAWGDQQFRTAMILKFMTFDWPTDFYYKGLPPYYPPLYFYLLALAGKMMSLPAYHMIKVGTLLLFAFGPAALYFTWRLLVTPLQAVCITVTVFVFAPIAVLASPHELLAGMFFIPWWLYCVERVPSVRDGWRRRVSGGVLGGAIFCCYYYAFLAAIPLVAGRTVWLVRRRASQAARRRLANMWVVLSFAAICSAPYWLPLLVSLLRYGAAPGQNRWFHLGYALHGFPLFEMTVPGLLLLLGFIYGLRRLREPLVRGLLLFCLSVAVFLLIGYILGNLDLPVLYIKALDIFRLLLIALLGLAVSAALRVGRRRRAWPAIAIFVVVTLTSLTYGYRAVIQDRAIETARRDRPQTSYFNMEHSPEKVGKVFLTDDTPLPAYFPAYVFIAAGEHYGHPAGRFQERKDLLELLQPFTDPYIFNTALRHNRFDRVDYLMPAMRKDSFSIPINLSNYPERLYAKSCCYSVNAISDTLLFRREAGTDCFRVENPPAVPRRPLGERASDEDSLLSLARLHILRRSLTPEGDSLLDVYLANVDSGWETLVSPEQSVDFDRLIRLLSIQSVPCGDSLNLVFEFRVLEDLATDYRIFLHAYRSPSDAAFRNCDFAPPRPSSTWKKGDIVLAGAKVELADGCGWVHFGFFGVNGRLGSGSWCRLRPSAVFAGDSPPPGY